MARIRDRYTKQVIEGPFELADDFEDAPCPECGADLGQACTHPEAGEISPYIHASRAEAGDTEGTQHP